jgi:hypothetical protein
MPGQNTAENLCSKTELVAVVIVVVVVRKEIPFLTGVA